MLCSRVILAKIKLILNLRQDKRNFPKNYVDIINRTNKNNIYTFVLLFWKNIYWTFKSLLSLKTCVSFLIHHFIQISFLVFHQFILHCDCVLHTWRWPVFICSRRVLSTVYFYMKVQLEIFTVRFLLPQFMMAFSPCLNFIQTGLIRTVPRINIENMVMKVNVSYDHIQCLV